MERIYTIPLGIVYKNPRTVRAKRAVKVVREFISRHMKTEETNVKMSIAVNSYLFMRGMKKPPRRIKVKANKDEKTGKVEIHLADADMEKKFLKNIVVYKDKEQEKKEEKKKEQEKKEEKKKEQEKKEEKQKIKEEGKKKEEKQEQTKKEPDKNEEKD